MFAVCILLRRPLSSSRSRVMLSTHSSHSLARDPSMHLTRHPPTPPRLPPSHLFHPALYRHFRVPQCDMTVASYCLYNIPQCSSDLERLMNWGQHTTMTNEDECVRVRRAKLLRTRLCDRNVWQQWLLQDEII